MVGLKCWDKWKTEKRQCPMCRKQNDLQWSVFYQEYINNLIVNCECGELVEIRYFVQHSAECAAINQLCASNTCKSHEKSKIEINLRNGKRFVCSQYCKFISKIQDTIKPVIKQDCNLVFKEVNIIVEKFFKKVTRPAKIHPNLHRAIKVPVKNPEISIAHQPIPPSLNGVCDFNFINTNINLDHLKIEGNRYKLNETSFEFHTLISDRPFLKSGIYYWEIEVDSDCENEMKIGVTSKINFHANTVYDDYETGFAYYGIGQLRHSDSSYGKKYGKPFKNAGVIGVLLNMTEGTLSFSLNSEYLGVAFTDNKYLANPPIYAAVSLIHKSGFKLITKAIAPSCFKLR